MKSSTVNISFNDELLKQIDQVAQEEFRSRSELIREAARTYIERKTRWKQIFAFAEARAKQQTMTAEDIAEEIAAYRQERQRQKNKE